jgi:hypothetical protein
MAVYDSRLSCMVSWRDRPFAEERAIQELIEGILDRFDVSGFRGSAPPMMLVGYGALSAHERVAGRAACLDILEEIGIDAPAAADALAREDRAALLQVASPAAHDEARRTAARDADNEEAARSACARHGLTEDELPF